MHALTAFKTQEQRDTHLGRPLRDRHQPLWQQDRVPHLHGAWPCLPGHDLPAHPTGAGGGGQGHRRVWRRCCRHQLNRSATPAGKSRNGSCFIFLTEATATNFYITGMLILLRVRKRR